MGTGGGRDGLATGNMSRGDAEVLRRRIDCSRYDDSGTVGEKEGLLKRAGAGKCADLEQSRGGSGGIAGGLSDFAFSIRVFHQIPSREEGRLLEPGRLFKCEAQVREMAERCGFQARYLVGLGEERLWVWLFKR